MPVVLPEKNAIVLKLRPEKHEAIKALFPIWEEVQHEGSTLLALPHTLDTNKILRNSGISTKGCEVFKFKYQFPEARAPWWWQVETAAFLSENTRAYCTSTPRTGKTYSVAMATDFLQSRGVRGVLVVAPLSTLDNVWEDTYANMPGVKLFVAHGSKDERRALLDIPADVYVINPDGIKVMEKELTEMVKDGRIQIIVVDELTNYANYQSDRWKALNKVAKGVPYMWGLTGTPGDPIDVYGQVKLISPGNLPRSMSAWKSDTMVQITPFKWIPATGHEAKVYKAMSPCIRYDKKDVMNVPTPEVVLVETVMSPQQSKVYEEMRADMMTEVGKTQITAATASIMASKLLQISAGCVKGTGGTIRLAMPERLARLDALIQSTPYKTVIFAAFTDVIDRLVDEIRIMGHTCEKIDGSVTGRKRSERFRSFMKTPNPKVLVCHPETTAFGVELAAADKLVFFGPPLSGDFKYQQAFERLSSSEQQSDKTFVYHMAGSPAERKLFANIQRGVDVNNNIVSAFTEIIQTHA
jgi:hypothetical protein